MKDKIQLKTLREIKNYSQTYMADKMGLSQSYYSKLENGQSKLTQELLERAISALGIESFHPFFIGNNNILESLEEYQLEFMNIKNRILTLEMQVKQLESDFFKLKYQ